MAGRTDDDAIPCVAEPGCQQCFQANTAPGNNPLAGLAGYFSILKRGIIDTYHHVCPQHLKQYLAEFDFRYNERMALGVDDDERARKAIEGVRGKRLTPPRPDGRADA